MAQIIEERVTFIVSRLIKDDDSSKDWGKSPAVTAETKESLLAVAQELLGDEVIVEVISGQ